MFKGRPGGGREEVREPRDQTYKSTQAAMQCWMRRHSEENDSKGKEVQDGEQRTRDVIQKELEDISSLLYACREDVKALWAHAAVRSLIDKRKLRLQESAEQ